MRRVPHPLPADPKKDRESGVVRAKSAQDLLEWAVLACVALFEQAPEVEKGAKAFLRGVSGTSYDGSAGRTYADDGTLPGPTPGLAARPNREAMLVKAYEANLKELRAVLLRLALAWDSFRVLPHGEAKKLSDDELGSKECKDCGKLQSATDYLRRGRCNACRMRVERAGAVSN